MKNKLKKNRMLLIALILCVLGLICLFIKGNSVEYIDSTNILHEKFYLIPISYLFIFTGLALGIVFIINTNKHKK